MADHSSVNLGLNMVIACNNANIQNHLLNALAQTQQMLITKSFCYKCTSVVPYIHILYSSACSEILEGDKY